jgi:hypothetical protein
VGSGHTLPYRPALDSDVGMQDFDHVRKLFRVSTDTRDRTINIPTELGLRDRGDFVIAPGASRTFWLGSGLSYPLGGARVPGLCVSSDF